MDGKKCGACGRVLRPLKVRRPSFADEGVDLWEQCRCFLEKERRRSEAVGEYLRESSRPERVARSGLIERPSLSAGGNAALGALSEAGVGGAVVVGAGPESNDIVSAHVWDLVQSGRFGRVLWADMQSVALWSFDEARALRDEPMLGLLGVGSGVSGATPPGFALDKFLSLVSARGSKPTFIAVVCSRKEMEARFGAAFCRRLLSLAGSRVVRGGGNG